jgi:hypothetical protein
MNNISFNQPTSTNLSTTADTNKILSSPYPNGSYWRFYGSDNSVVIPEGCFTEVLQSGPDGLEIVVGREYTFEFSLTDASGSSYSGWWTYLYENGNNGKSLLHISEYDNFLRDTNYLPADVWTNRADFVITEVFDPNQVGATTCGIRVLCIQGSGKLLDPNTSIAKTFFVTTELAQSIESIVSNQPIAQNQVAIGNGTGITSSNLFTFNKQINFLNVGSHSIDIFTENSSIVSGFENKLLGGYEPGPENQFCHLYFSKNLTGDALSTFMDTVRAIALDADLTEDYYIRFSVSESESYTLDLTTLEIVDEINHFHILEWFNDNVPGATATGDDNSLLFEWNFGPVACDAESRYQMKCSWVTGPEQCSTGCELVFQKSLVGFNPNAQFIPEHIDPSDSDDPYYVSANRIGVPFVPEVLEKTGCEIVFSRTLSYSETNGFMNQVAAVGQNDTYQYLSFAIVPFFEFTGLGMFGLFGARATYTDWFEELYSGTVNFQFTDCDGNRVGDVIADIPPDMSALSDGQFSSFKNVVENLNWPAGISVVVSQDQDDKVIFKFSIENGIQGYCGITAWTYYAGSGETVYFIKPEKYFPVVSPPQDVVIYNMFVGDENPSISDILDFCNDNIPGMSASYIGGSNRTTFNWTVDVKCSKTFPNSGMGYRFQCGLGNALPPIDTPTPVIGLTQSGSVPYFDTIFWQTNLNECLCSSFCGGSASHLFDYRSDSGQAIDWARRVKTYQGKYLGFWIEEEDGSVGSVKYSLSKLLIGQSNLSNIQYLNHIISWANTIPNMDAKFGNVYLKRFSITNFDVNWIEGVLDGDEADSNDYDEWGIRLFIEEGDGKAPFPKKLSTAEPTRPWSSLYQAYFIDYPWPQSNFTYEGGVLNWRLGAAGYYFYGGNVPEWKIVPDTAGMEKMTWPGPENDGKFTLNIDPVFVTVALQKGSSGNWANFEPIAVANGQAQGWNVFVAAKVPIGELSFEWSPGVHPWYGSAYQDGEEFGSAQGVALQNINGEYEIASDGDTYLKWSPAMPCGKPMRFKMGILNADNTLHAELPWGGIQALSQTCPCPVGDGVVIIDDEPDTGETPSAEMVSDCGCVSKTRSIYDLKKTTLRAAPEVQYMTWALYDGTSYFNINKLEIPQQGFSTIDEVIDYVNTIDGMVCTYDASTTLLSYEWTVSVDCNTKVWFRNLIMDVDDNPYSIIFSTNYQNCFGNESEISFLWTTPEQSCLCGHETNSDDISNSTILSGENNTMTQTVKESSILVGSDNKISDYINSSTILGGVDNELKTHSCQSSIISGEMNFIGENSCNSSIIGGSKNTMYGSSINSSILAGKENKISKTSPMSVVIGGELNTITSISSRSSIISGCNNTITTSTKLSSIINGNCNLVSTRTIQSTVLGGACNTIIGDVFNSSIVGGISNRLFYGPISSAIIGGVENHLIGDSSGVISASRMGVIGTFSKYSAIVSGCKNEITDFSSMTSIIGGCGNIARCQIKQSTIIGGSGNSLVGFLSNSSITGGRYNCISDCSSNSSIVGGRSNLIEENSIKNAIISGEFNCINSNVSDSQINGGRCNVITDQSSSSIIDGGYKNIITGCVQQSVIIGGSDNQLRDSSTRGGIIGGLQNTIGTSSNNSTISGGQSNMIIFDSHESAIVGGFSNKISTSSCRSNILGGTLNTITMTSSNVVSLGGMSNKIECSSDSSTTLGGSSNTISNSKRTSILGGFSNIISNNTYQGSIVGGQSNTICSYSDNSIILGGNNSFIGRSGASSFGFNQRSSIIGGGSNCILTCSCNSTISGGLTNVISSSSSNSSIIGGRLNRIGTQSSNSSIVGGQCNSIFNSNSSVIIGGTGLSLTSEDNTVYIPSLKIDAVSVSSTNTNLLVWNDTTKNVNYRSLQTLAGTGITISTSGTISVSGAGSQGATGPQGATGSQGPIGPTGIGQSSADLTFTTVGKRNLVTNPVSLGTLTEINGISTAGSCFIYGGIAKLDVSDLSGTTGNLVILDSNDNIVLKSSNVSASGNVTFAPQGGPWLVQGDETLTLGVTGGNTTNLSVATASINPLKIYYIYDPIDVIL